MNLRYFANRRRWGWTLSIMSWYQWFVIDFCWLSEVCDKISKAVTCPDDSKHLYFYFYMSLLTLGSVWSAQNIRHMIPLFCYWWWRASSLQSNTLNIHQKDSLKASNLSFFEVVFTQVHDIFTEEQQAVSFGPFVLKIPHAQRPWQRVGIWIAISWLTLPNRLISTVKSHKSTEILEHINNYPHFAAQEDVQISCRY